MMTNLLGTSTKAQGKSCGVVCINRYFWNQKISNFYMRKHPIHLKNNMIRAATLKSEEAGVCEYNR